MNKAEMIVALDVPNSEAMEAKLQEMPDFIAWYKDSFETSTGWLIWSG